MLRLKARARDEQEKTGKTGLYRCRWGIVSLLYLAVVHREQTRGDVRGVVGAIDPELRDSCAGELSSWQVAIL